VVTKTRASTGAPLTRRTHVPGAERREQILEAAAALFARRGFAGTTTREIAAAVGVSETLLFRHFPTKEQLYRAILESRVPAAGLERWFAKLRRIADTRDDEALFSTIATDILRSYHDQLTYHRLVLFASLEENELAGIAHAKHTMPLGAFLREYVVQRQAEGAFRRMRPEALVQVLLSIPAQFAQWKALGVNPFGLSERDVAAQVRTILHGCLERE
jgi:TetR/AcrR family transcriptional regulator